MLFNHNYIPFIIANLLWLTLLLWSVYNCILFNYDFNISENQVYQFFVRATDNGIPPQHNDVSVNVYIMASSDNPPIFERREDKIFITESAAPGIFWDILLHSY